jgi:siroheme synthase (precorrin-2 oxidase/ferrochelatase)
MNAGFQVTLDLDGRQCLVIGGDEEAVEKINRLLDADYMWICENSRLREKLFTVDEAFVRRTHRMWC